MWEFCRCSRCQWSWSPRRSLWRTRRGRAGRCLAGGEMIFFTILIIFFKTFLKSAAARGGGREVWGEAGKGYHRTGKDVSQVKNHPFSQIVPKIKKSNIISNHQGRPRHQDAPAAGEHELFERGAMRQAGDAAEGGQGKTKWRISHNWNKNIWIWISKTQFTLAESERKYDDIARKLHGKEEEMQRSEERWQVNSKRGQITWFPNQNSNNLIKVRAVREEDNRPGGGIAGGWAEPPAAWGVRGDGATEGGELPEPAEVPLGLTKGFELNF